MNSNLNLGHYSQVRHTASSSFSEDYGKQAGKSFSFFFFLS